MQKLAPKVYIVASDRCKECQMLLSCARFSLKIAVACITFAVSYIYDNR